MTTSRSDPLRGIVRGVRAGVLTVPAVGVGVVAHYSADGCVSLLSVLLALGLCWPGAVALLGAQRRVPALVAGLLASQFLTHALLEWGCPPLGHEAMAGQLGLPMLAAHVVACLLLAVVLGRADAGLWAARRLVWAAARMFTICGALRLPLGPVAVLRILPVVTRFVRPRVAWQAALPVRRGPPVAGAL